MPNSITPPNVAKPRPDFPLFPHATGRWAKKVKRSLLYFGATANDPHGDNALAAWINEKDFCLLHGRRPSKDERKPVRRATKASNKPGKPYPDFPLFPHATGRWAKKIRGNLYYFGKVADDPDGAAAAVKYEEQREDLYAGRKPRAKTDGLTLKELVNKFLTVKKTLRDEGELSPQTFHGYYRVCTMLLRVLGKQRAVSDLRTEDFEAVRTATFSGLALETRKVLVRQVHALFNFAYNESLIDRPLRFGTAFKAPSKKNLQKDRVAKKEARLLTADQIRALIAEANVYLRAMILLGINCGMGNYDIAMLTAASLDLDGGWLDDARHKTGVVRRCKLWPETVDALRQAIAQRRKPKDAAFADLIFISKFGHPFVRWAKQVVPDLSKNTWRDAVSRVSWSLFQKLGINGGASFYSLRRMTETIGGGCKDQVAVDAVMGHARGDMASVYRLDIEDSRLEAVADHIHQWLYGT